MAGITMTVIITLLLMVFGELLLGFFNQDPEVIRIGYRIMWFCVPCYVFWVLIEVFSGALRGSGDALIPMVLNLVGICALRLVWLYTVVPAHHTIDTIMLSYPVTWVITGTAFMIYYFRGGWTKRTLTKAAEES